MKKICEKILSIVMIFVMSFTYLVPVTVFANAPANTTGFTRIDIGGNATSITNVNDGTSVTLTYPHGTVTVTGTHLYSDTTANNGVYYIYTSGNSATVTATPDANYNGTLWQNGQNLNTTTTNLTNLNPAGPGPRVDADFYDTAPGTGNNRVCTGTNCASATLNYTPAQNEEPIDIIINGTEVAVGEAPENPISYNYDVTDDPGTVTFDIAVIFLSRLQSLTINGQSCYTDNNVTKDELLNRFFGQRFNYQCEVNKANTYNVEAHTTRTEPELMPIGNFLWTYDPAEIGTDDSVYGGKLEFVSLKYNGVTYNSLAELAAPNKEYLSWNNAIVTDNDPNGYTGGAVLPAGAELTVKLIPNAGYQLVSFGVNGGTFEPQEEIGVYTFNVGLGNFHLAAHFRQVDDVVETTSSKVSSGSIVLDNESSMRKGTAKLTVSDANNLSDEQKEKFVKEAGSYKVKNYLNISLYNTVYKGTPDEAWDTDVKDLDNEATITLQLEEGIDGNDVVIVHEHNGEYEVIPVTYDPVAHTITFKTKGFSNYAIASKTTNPNTSDNIMTYFIMFMISGFGYLLTEILRRKNKASV